MYILFYQNFFFNNSCKYFYFLQVKIMLPWDPAGKMGPKKPLPDHVQIVEPKEETLPTSPFSETKAVKPDQPPVPI